MHSTSNLEDGYMGSGTILRRSIRKHGKDNHTKEILEYLSNRELLILREIEIVTKELISDGKCMNLKEGGSGGFSNEEHMKKCHLAFKDKGHSEKTKKLLSELRKGTGIGVANSQYGTVWMTKEGVNKKIKKEDFETYVLNGWLKGRKLPYYQLNQI